MTNNLRILLFTRLAIEKFLFKSDCVGPNSGTFQLLYSLIDCCLITSLLCQEREKTNEEKNKFKICAKF